jgi:DNA-binding transcriptional MerR regulator/effector-binding domain-containing protein
MPKGIFSISAFARYSRTTKDTLLHYDRIGLLSPSIRKENGYRYYSPAQLATMNVIRILRDVGLSLAEIKGLIDSRNPENFDVTFDEQIAKIDKKIDELSSTRELLKTLRRNIHDGLAIDEKSMSINYLPESPMFVGEINDYSDGKDDFDAVNVFYKKTSEKYPDLNLNYPVWGLFSEEKIKKRDWKYPDRFYFYHPKGDEKRDAGEYAIGYFRGGYGQSEKMYSRMLTYIEEEGYIICGDTYEEYILDEISISDDTNYLIRLMVNVKKSLDSRL